MAYTYKAEEVISKFNHYRSYKSTMLREWRVIRALYRGEFWAIFNKNLKEYTITPDWNYFEYVVSGYLNSIYSGSFIGTLTPRFAQDTERVDTLNAFIQYQWSKWGMKNKFLHIGENGELYNLGAVRVDWNATLGHIELKALSPDEVYLDPSVSCYKDGEAVFIERAVNIDVLKQNENFVKGVEAYEKKMKNSLQNKTLPYKIAINENRVDTNNKTVSLVECFIRNKEGKIDQVFILDEAEIIFEKTGLPFNQFPIVCFSPQRPDGNPYGNSKLTKILNTVIALNMLDSIEATQPYRLLNRVRFVNVDGRINMRSFADYGNTPGASFETRGDPRTIVFYQDIPTIPDLSNIKQRLENSIFQVTGVDPYYKGRATNSVQTTGATQAFQARVTMLTDNSRIIMLEEFCEDLTRIIVEYYYQFAGEAKYTVPKLSALGTNKVVEERELNFSEYSDPARTTPFDYHISASVLLPMNQANLFESAKALYEMQGQYGFEKPVITPEDLIRYSDFPQKQLILERMAKDDQSKIAETLVADLTNFATIFSRLLSQGLSEEEAAQQSISILIEEKNAMKNNPAVGRGFE